MNRIGCNVSLADDTCLGDGITLGNNVTVYPGVTIGDGCAIFDGAVLGRPPKSAGNTTRLLKDATPLTLGAGSIVGANAVVSTSVPPFCVVAGNPAKIVKRYDPETCTWVKAKG